MIISDLDDFILPSQACINPFVGTTAPSEATASTTTTTTTKGGGGAAGRSSSSSGAVRLNLGSDLGYEEPTDKGIFKSTGVGVIKTKAGANDVKVATVALTDCLACSGCVTSAEAVLIQTHSHHKLTERLAASGQASAFVVVTLSPQSVASIANLLNKSFADTFRALATALKACGVRYVFDAASGGDVALVEARDQFIRRYRAGVRGLWSPPAHYSIAVSADRETVLGPDGSQTTKIYTTSSGGGGGPTGTSGSDVTPPASSGSGGALPLPMLCSHCPGWVCYAEKTQPQSLPYIDSTKSSQQIIGAVLKRLILPRILPSVNIADVFHVAIMPCFDKKLEATRKDFYHDDIVCNEVDLVLSTVELINFLVSSHRTLVPDDEASDIGASATTSSSTIGSDSSADIDSKSEDDAVEAHVNASIVSNEVRERLQKSLASVSSSSSCRDLDSLSGQDHIESLFRHASPDGLTVVSASDSNGSSGGYLEYIYRYAAQELFNDNIWTERIEYVVGRNEDFAELTVSGGDENRPSRKLKFARAYGFRNIQSVMMKMKTKRCQYDFVEIMACPKGCANGGGQPKAQERETPTVTRDRVAAVVSRMGEVVVASPDESPLVRWLYGGRGFSVDVDTNTTSSCTSYNEQQTLRSILHTRYHAVPKLEELAPLATANKW